MRSLVNATELYRNDGLLLFRQGGAVELEIVYDNNSFETKKFDQYNECLEYFEHFKTNLIRDFLLNSKTFRITVHLGNNNKLSSYQIVGEFTVHKDLMV